jgi:hypothetical protein
MATLTPVVLNGLLQLDIPEFKLMFPDVFDAVPDVTIQINWEIASTYMSQSVSGDIRVMSQYILCNQATAHLIKTQAMVAAGKAPRIVVSATTDNVTRVILPPPVNKSYYQWFFSQTQYGQAFLALLDQVSSGGAYMGGSYALAALG